MSDLVIGEGVALDLRLAKLPSRALAKLLDSLVQGFGFVLLLGVTGAGLGGLDSAVQAAVGIILTVLVLVGYPVLFESATRGRTLGKMALGLRVVRTDGGPLRFRHALVRGLTGIFDFTVTAGILAAVTSFCSRDGRRTGDFLAGTVVVRERVPDAGTTPQGLAALSMPYPLLGWAQTLDLSRLPDDTALAARQFLTRMHEFRPEVAARMSYDLATELATYVQAPPQGTPAWAYLAAVTAERRARQFRKTEMERRAAWEQHNARMRTAWQYQQQGQVQPPMPQAVPAARDAVPTAQPYATQPSAEQPSGEQASAEQARPSSPDDGFAPPQ